MGNHAGKKRWEAKQLWYPAILHKQTHASSCICKHLHTHRHSHTRKHKQTNRQTDSCQCHLDSVLLHPCLVFCLFVGEVVCVVVKVKGKHSSSSSDVWTCWECPPEPAEQLDPLAVTDRGCSFTPAGQTEYDQIGLINTFYSKQNFDKYSDICLCHSIPLSLQLLCTNIYFHIWFMFLIIM